MHAWRWVLIVGLVGGCLGAVLAETPAKEAVPVSPPSSAPTAGAKFLADGDTLLATKDYARALSKYVLAWLEMPDNPVVSYRIGNLYAASGKLAEATRFYAVAVKLNEGFEEPVLALAQTYLRLKRADQTRILLEEPHRLARFTKSARYHQFLGQAYLALGKYSLAIAQFQTGQSLAPEQGALYGDLGNAYYLTGRHVEAVEAYTTALAKDATDATAALHRSLAQEKLGQVPEAIKSLELYLTLVKAGADDPQRTRLTQMQRTASGQ
jgi:tetratricopeptide (TPR) repeat protein